MSKRRSPALMVQGTGSNVGKSLVVAGLCRLFSNRGLKVAPFKPQNMSNNAAVAENGGEIGRAQALQALAARAPLSVHMNPILLKPETDVGAQVIVQGRRFGAMKAKEYGSKKYELLPMVMESFSSVSSNADLVLVEGAGSPAEINLRAGDIANMGFAEAADLPVILCGDIDRGGVIASLVGTHSVLEPEERARIKGFFINRFRGDASLFVEGEREIAARTGWPSLGVIPWFQNASKLPAEDAMDLASGAGANAGRVKIAVPVISRIANFDDLDPLRMEPEVTLELVEPGQPLPGDADLVLLPGTKSTIGDLAFFCAQGWEVDLAGHMRRGGQVLGVCGGFQMLGREIHDPEGIEGPAGSVQGLGYLDVETTLTSEKRVVEVQGEDKRFGEMIRGYEIHIGRTRGTDLARPFCEISFEGGAAHEDGACSLNGRALGTYVHGLFAADGFRRAFLKELGAGSSLNYQTLVDQTLEELASHLERALDIELLLKIANQS